MDQITDYSISNIYSEFHKKYKKYSELRENIPRIKLKRQKFAKSKNEDTDNCKNNLNKRSKVKNVPVASHTNYKTEYNNENKKFKITSTTNKDLLNDAFIEVKEGAEISKVKLEERKRKQRRLSGLFRNNLNTGFIEGDPLDEEDISLVEEISLVSISREKQSRQTNNPGFKQRIEEVVTVDGKEEQRNEIQFAGTVPTTPVKKKLRSRQKKQPTEEEIINYYTDKTIKKKQNNLETIFEIPKPELMSIKRYKRFINFNERMSTVKVKKRSNKIVRYNLWQNTEPVSMDYFLRKLEEDEEDS